MHSEPHDSTIKVAEQWEAYAGPSRWTQAVRELASRGWHVRAYSGRPGSSSAIGLTFEIAKPDGESFPCSYRLSDLEHAVRAARGEQMPEHRCEGCNEHLAWADELARRGRFVRCHKCQRNNWLSRQQAPDVAATVSARKHRAANG